MQAGAPPTTPPPTNRDRETRESGSGRFELSELASGPLAPRRERAAAVEVVASAFRDNPLNLAVIGGTRRRRLRANRAGARAGFAAPPGRPAPLRLAAWVDGPDGPEAASPRLAGVLLGVAPFGFPAPPPPALAQLRALWGQGWRVANRWGEVYQTLVAVHPHEAHWYLDILAVAPEYQGRGVGRALLDRFVARVDAEQQPSYLETDRNENLAFYGAAGYEVVNTSRVLDTEVWCLWRDAR